MLRILTASAYTEFIISFNDLMQSVLQMFKVKIIKIPSAGAGGMCVGIFISFAGWLFVRIKFINKSSYLFFQRYLNKICSSRKLEKECSRNKELQWLLQNLAPNYHTIADFRKLHPKPLQAIFKLYVQFLGDAGLLGKTTMGIDGSKFKAVNSKKNNYSKKKIDKHQQFIKDKTEKYLQELDEMDNEENNTGADELQIKKEKIEEGLAKLKERTVKYDTLQQQLNNTDDKQISTIDIDSRSILVTKAIVEVAYNTHNAVDDKIQPYCAYTSQQQQ